jgi:hypothetical protein
MRIGARRVDCGGAIRRRSRPCPYRNYNGGARSQENSQCALVRPLAHGGNLYKKLAPWEVRFGTLAQESEVAAIMVRAALGGAPSKGTSLGGTNAGAPRPECRAWSMRQPLRSKDVRAIDGEVRAVLTELVNAAPGDGSWSR